MEGFGKEGTWVVGCRGVMERVNILKINGITVRSKTETTTIVKRMKGIVPQDIKINDIIINNITEVSITI